MEIFEEFSGSNDHMIVKGKRTKRPRPSSSASSNGGGCGGEFYNALVSSPTTSSTVISTSSEEDEDMANCLILLARGSSPPAPEEEIRFNGRKFAEIATGKLAIYVYECKACNRSFPSFQALGGHRASHKKNKPTTENNQKKSPPPPPPDDREQPRSTQALSKNCHSDQNKPKIHECSICGSEFASGQALGGHMRRHRPAPKNDTSSHDVDVKPKSMLTLDLNLPAPSEDENLQQPHIGFSAAALVDCHY